MLSFHALDTSPVRVPLRHAYLLGPEELQVSGAVDYDAESGLVRCEKPEGETAALALQVDLGEQTMNRLSEGDADRPLADIPPAGIITLQTCLLPDRAEPYLLTLELARHRIMLFLNKLEDWQLFDITADDPVMVLFERARSCFTRALCAPRSTPEDLREADRLAAIALCLAVHAGEALVARDASRTFVPRTTGQTYLRARREAGAGPIVKGKPVLPISSPERVGLSLPGRPALGVMVSPGSFNERFQDVAARTSDFVSMPMRWLELEPTEGVYQFGPTDRWIEWAVRKAKLPVVAGPLLDARPKRIPRWISMWQMPSDDVEHQDYRTLRDLVCDHIRNVVTRYRRTISRWTVASGLHENTQFRLSFDQIMDLTKSCVSVVRQLHPTGRIQLELTQPWGEYYSQNRRALPPLLYAEMVTQAGVMVDSYSIRLQMGQPAPGESARDLMAISAMIDRYAALDKPLALTIGVPSGVTESTGDPANLDHHPGYWHEPWSESVQEDWAHRVSSMLLSKPFVQSVCWFELYDLPEPAEMPRGGLVSMNGQAKPATHRLSQLRDAVREGRLPESLDHPGGVLISRDG